MKDKTLEKLFNLGDIIVGTFIASAIIFGTICELAPLSLTFVNF